MLSVTLRYQEAQRFIDDEYVFFKDYHAQVEAVEI